MKIVVYMGGRVIGFSKRGGDNFIFMRAERRIKDRERERKREKALWL